MMFGKVGNAHRNWKSGVKKFADKRSGVHFFICHKIQKRR